MSRRTRVGICAWADPALIETGTFYPRKSMSAEARLRHYASVFDVVEVNSSYYAIPDVRNSQRWVERTPEGFIFHVKAYSLMTGHNPRAETVPADLVALLPRSPQRTRRGEIDATSFSPEAVNRAFQLFRAAVGPIAESGKLGYVLFQFAPWVHFDTARLDYLASLPARLPGWTLAIEFRHRSWLPEHIDETLRALSEARLAHVIVDAPPGGHAIPRITTATSPTAVFRLHGRNAEGWLRQLRGEEPTVREKYDYLYSEGELRALLPEIEAISAETEDVFISFNNNNRDYPVKNALMMKRLLGQPTASEPTPLDLFP
ncbi:MAG TPA: DUF72 domain-containing protein [Methylomirabilota bacterium]|nr:DUF72 domain-containing protein [Methylomirabilota bacterium]